MIPTGHADGQGGSTAMHSNSTPLKRMSVGVKKGLVYQIHVILMQRKVDFASLDWADWTLFSLVPMLGYASLIAAVGSVMSTSRGVYGTRARHRGRDHAPAACRHLRRMVPHVVDRQEPGQDLAKRMPSANLL